MGAFGLLPLVVAAVLLSAGAVRACSGLADGPAGVVASVTDGNDLTLDSGITVRLLGTLAPMPAGRRRASVGEPMAAAAQAALGQLVLNKPVRLGLDKEETDRYGRMEAQVFLDAPPRQAAAGAPDQPASMWVEQALVERGMARVAAQPPDIRCADELLATEAGARANGLGIWRDPYYTIRDAGDPAALGAFAGHYEIIEGDVVSTGKTRQRIYLDFGRIWKDDVTATIDARAQALFASAGLDPMTLKGRRVRLRGWVEDRDGPLIEIGSPSQVEVLGSK